MRSRRFLARRLFVIGQRLAAMREHPYRAPGSKVARRAKAETWAVALVVVWSASVGRAIAALFDHALAAPLTGLSIAVAVGVPFIAAHAKVLAGDE